MDPKKPIEIYTRRLPHWRQEGATYFVTYRLIDSLPQALLDELAQLKKEWERKLEERRANAEAELSKEGGREI